VKTPNTHKTLFKLQKLAHFGSCPFLSQQLDLWMLGFLFTLSLLHHHHFSSTDLLLCHTNQIQQPFPLASWDLPPNAYTQYRILLGCILLMKLLHMHTLLRSTFTHRHLLQISHKFNKKDKKGLHYTNLSI